MSEFTLDANELEVYNKIENRINLEEKQNSFLETSLGKVINYGIDVGIKSILPDFIEEDIIEIKNTLIEEGFSSALDVAINNAVSLGKNVIGIVTGNIENISQAEDIIKKGGLLDSVSSLLDTAINKADNLNLINNNMATLIKNGKNIILDRVSENIDKKFESQVDSLENIEKYINNWTKYYKKENFSSMEKEYLKMEEELEKLLPLEKIITKAKQIENLHNLIKNNGKNFNLSEEEKEISKKLL